MKTSKKYLAILLTLCTLLCSIISYSVYAVTVEKETPISADADLGNEGELMPMAATPCYSTLGAFMNTYSGQYGFTYNNTGLGSDVALSNGYYYHAVAQTNYYVVYLYNSSGNCVQYAYFSSL